MAVITKGIELYFVSMPHGDEPFAALGTDVEGKGILLPNLQEIGDLGTGASAERDKIEITTLADDKHVFTQGLLAETEYESIEFKFLYDAVAYKCFIDAVEAERSYTEAQANEGTQYKLFIPNPEEPAKPNAFTINGTTGVKLDGAGVNAALTMTVTITPVKEIVFA